MKYCGLEFSVAKNIFVNDKWLNDFTAEKNNRWIKFELVGDNYQVEKPKRATNNPATNHTDYILMNNAPSEYKDKNTRKNITESDLANNDPLLRLFLFSVNGNKGPYVIMKTNISIITQNLMFSNNKKTYKHYVGHVAWLKATAWDAYKDPLTVKLFAMAPSMEINDDNIKNITFNHTDQYYTRFSEFLSDTSQHTPEITAGLSMDLANFELYYSDLKSRGQLVGSMSRASLHLPRRSVSRKRRSPRSPRKKTMRLGSNPSHSNSM